jgi:hypothetical protein
MPCSRLCCVRTGRSTSTRPRATTRFRSSGSNGRRRSRRQRPRDRANPRLRRPQGLRRRSLRTPPSRRLRRPSIRCQRSLSSTTTPGPNRRDEAAACATSIPPRSVATLWRVGIPRSTRRRRGSKPRSATVRSAAGCSARRRRASAAISRRNCAGRRKAPKPSSRACVGMAAKADPRGSAVQTLAQEVRIGFPKCQFHLGAQPTTQCARRLVGLRVATGFLVCFPVHTDAALLP